MIREILENISASIDEPVSIDDAKEHLRIDASDEDALIRGYLTAARQVAENYANRVIASQQFRLTLDSFPLQIHLPKTPVISVDSFTYVDTNGDSQTLSSGSGYFLSNDDFDPVLKPPYNSSWPDTESGFEKVVITFTAGFSAVPQNVKSAILLIVGDLYNNREHSAPITLHEVSFSSRSLLDPIKRVIV